MTVCVCWLTHVGLLWRVLCEPIVTVRGPRRWGQRSPRCRSRDKGHWRAATGRRSIAAERQQCRLLKILEQETAVTTVTTQRVPAQLVMSLCDGDRGMVDLLGGRVPTSRR